MRKSFYVLGLLFSCFILNSVTALASPTLTPGAPAVTANPKDTTICNGLGAWFAITANDTLGGDTMRIVYTWEVSTNGGSTWDTVHNGGIYSHATTDTLKISAATRAMNGYMYMCGAANDSGTTWSDAATLHVDTAYAGTITGDTSVCKHSSTTLTSSIAGGTWRNVNHAIDTINSAGAYYGLSQGFDTVKYTDTNKCGVYVSTYVVRVDTFVSNLPITGPTVTCVGNFVTLMNENVLGNHTWTASNTAAEVDGNGKLTGRAGGGLDTITYAFQNACNSIDTTIVVRVDTVLAHGTISGTNQLCTGTWVTLTATLPDGSWISSNSSIAIVDGDGNVTGVSQGVAIISYYYANGCGVSTATDTVTVHRTTSDITGIDSVGIGAMRTLFDTTVGGGWSIADTSIAKIDSATGTITGVAVGSTTVTYTVTNLCGTTSATITLYVGHNPSAGAILGPDSVCLGHTITLSDAAAPGGVWSSANDSIASIDANTGLLTGNAYGSVHISYTYTNAFGSTTISKSVFVNRAPHDSLNVPSIFSLSGYYTFVGYPAGGTWTTSNDTVGNFLGSPGFFVIYHWGIDTVTYSVTNTCGTTDTSFVVYVPSPGGGTSGVGQVANSGAVLNVYPNPSTGDLTINLLSANDEKAVVTITNIVGTKVKELTINTNKAAVLNLDQPDGIYFLTATAPSGKYSAKITITK